MMSDDKPDPLTCYAIEQCAARGIRFALNAAAASFAQKEAPQQEVIAVSLLAAFASSVPLCAQASAFDFFFRFFHIDPWVVNY